MTSAMQYQPQPELSYLPSLPLQLANFIDGEWRAPASGRFLENINPATGAVLCQVPDSDEEDVAAATQAALAAFPRWSATPVEERFNILNCIATRIDQQRDDLALAETLDNGK